MSLEHAANGNSGGPGGQRGGQNGGGTQRGPTGQTATETIQHSAITIEFNISDWVRNGKPKPSFQGRVQDWANIVTKHCPEVQLAPLPHLQGGEDLPCVGRADKSADDVFNIPKDQFKFYAHEGDTRVERSTSKTIMRGYVGIRSTITLRQIKERKGVSEFLMKKNRDIYMKMNNTSALRTVPIGFIFRTHTALPLYEDIAKEITEACDLNVSANGKYEIEVTARNVSFGNCRAWFLNISAAADNVDEIKRKIRNGMGSIAGDKSAAMTTRPLTYNSCFVSYNSSDVGDVLTDDFKARLCENQNRMAATTEGTGIKNMQRNGIDTVVCFNTDNGEVNQTVRQWLEREITSEKDRTKPLVLNMFRCRRDGKMLPNSDKVAISCAVVYR